ncbi:ABC-three component system protein [Lysinibacillus sp. NPDC058147]|uniref:ABC-three component system protein n=1 Tax=unclassified Lysinibacillus TaxID=2636778 RepID=UPI0036D9C378
MVYHPHTKAFEELKSELHDCIADLLDEKYENSYKKVKKVTTESRTFSLDNNNPLTAVMTSNDKHGMCHHLVNDKKIAWVKNGNL